MEPDPVVVRVVHERDADPDERLAGAQLHLDRHLGRLVSAVRPSHRSRPRGQSYGVARRGARGRARSGRPSTLDAAAVDDRVARRRRRSCRSRRSRRHRRCGPLPPSASPSAASSRGSRRPPPRPQQAVRHRSPIGAMRTGFGHRPRPRPARTAVQPSAGTGTSAASVRRARATIRTCQSSSGAAASLPSPRPAARRRRATPDRHRCRPRG